jgi:DNA-binding HxlR family transcriptional regulator
MSQAVVSHTSVTCPIARTAAIISGKWTLLIIRDLAQETQRFCQLERSLQGISPKTLSDRLHALESEGIVRRQTFGEVPPRVEYSLTEKGRALADIIEAMRAFGSAWLMSDAPECGCDDVAISPEHVFANIVTSHR